MEEICIRINEKTTKGGKKLLTWISDHLRDLNMKKKVFSFKLANKTEIDLLKRDGVKLPTTIIKGQKLMGADAIINALKSGGGNIEPREMTEESMVREWQTRAMTKPKNGSGDDDEEDSPGKREMDIQQRVSAEARRRGIAGGASRPNNITQPSSSATSSAQQQTSTTPTPQGSSTQAKTPDEALIMNMLETT